MANIKAYIAAARLRTLPLAIAGIALGAGLASLLNTHSWSVTLLAVLTAILLQILSNFANDYGDFSSGVDVHRKDRALSSGMLGQAQMKKALYILGALTLGVGVLLLWVSFGTINVNAFLFLLFGLAAIYAALKYTAGKKPYGYRALGDLAVLIFFGWISVLGTYFLQTNVVDTHFYYAILPATAFGLLSVGVLNINNIRDIEGDTQNNKITLAVKLGHKGAVVYQLILILVAFLLLAAYLYFVFRLNTFSSLLLLPLYIFNWFQLRALPKKVSDQVRPRYNDQLKYMVLSNAFLVAIFVLQILNT